jgi:hypothetical protein
VPVSIRLLRAETHAPSPEIEGEAVQGIGAGTVCQP